MHGHFHREGEIFQRDMALTTCGGPTLNGLPDELLAEIAVNAPLHAFRLVVRFNIHAVAATRITRWYRHWRAFLPPAGWRPVVGDRVVFRWPASCRKPPSFATVAANRGYHCGRQVWSLKLLNEKHVTAHVGRFRPIQGWADGPWHNFTGRTSSIAAASVAREAATRATHAAVAAMIRIIFLIDSERPTPFFQLHQRLKTSIFMFSGMHMC